MVSSGSEHEKHLKPRGRRPSGFIVFERLETWWNPKHKILKYLLQQRKLVYSGYQSHAPFNDFLFSISKAKFWWALVKCFHDNSRVHFVSVSPPCSIVVWSGIIAQLLWQSNLQFRWNGGLVCRENVVCLWITWQKHFKNILLSKWHLIEVSI